jgi:hypothetical protein
MSYLSPRWEFVADIHLMELQHLQNMVPHTNGKFPSITLICDMHMTSQIPYV